MKHLCKKEKIKETSQKHLKNKYYGKIIHNQASVLLLNGKG